MLTVWFTSQLVRKIQVKEAKYHTGINFWIARKLKSFSSFQEPGRSCWMMEKVNRGHTLGQMEKIQGCSIQNSWSGQILHYCRKTTFTLPPSILETSLELSGLFHEPLQLLNPTENHMLFFCGVRVGVFCCYALGFFGFSLVKFLDCLLENTSVYCGNLWSMSWHKIKLRNVQLSWCWGAMRLIVSLGP